MIPDLMTYRDYYIPEDVGGSLKDMRQRVGLRQKEVSVRLGWHKNTISVLETGRHILNIPKLLALADACRVHPLTAMVYVLRAIGQYNNLPDDLRTRLDLFTDDDILHGSGSE